MHRLTLRMLGPPVVEVDDVTTEVKPRKALAILVYLACEGGRQTRDTLATLLWPDSGQSQARASLRRRLSELDLTLDGEWLQAEREYVALSDAPDLHIDVAEFEAHLAECATHGHDLREVCAECRQPLESAVALYKGDFLTGFTLQDCAEFDDWQFFKAEDLRLALSEALQRLITLYNQRGDYASALPHARQLLSLDPLHEPAHHELMRLYARTGQQSAALRQYEVCSDLLETELGVAVSDETIQLRDDIVARNLRAEVPRNSIFQPESFTDMDTGRFERGQDATEPANVQDDIRVVTVLDADFSFPVEESWDDGIARGAEQLARLLQRAPDLMKAYDAFISRSSGAGFQALFGLSRVHEDDAERAILAAIDIQSAAKEAGLELTVGVNTGVVYVSRSETGVMATGPTVTLASRLQSVASPGEILVSESTYRHTRGAVRYTSHDAGRGMAGIFRVERLRRIARKARGVEGLHAQLVGRDEELSKLQAALEQTMQGEGQIAFVIGEAGVGKSRLIAELRASEPTQIDDDRAVRWLEGRCLEMTSASAYAPIVSVLRGYFGLGPDDSEEARAGKIFDKLNEMAHQGVLRREQLALTGSVLGNLMSIRFNSDWDEWTDSASPERIRLQTFQTLGDLILAMGQRHACVFVLEDLHWADALSLDLIAFLMERLQGAHLMLLCTYRLDQSHRSSQLATIAGRICPDRHMELRLRELTPVQLGQLLARLIGHDQVSPEIQRTIYRQCQGNPYYLEEILHALIGSGELVDTDEGWRLPTTLTNVSVPASVQGVTLSRFDRLSARAKNLLQHAAVLGHRFDKMLLNLLIGGDAGVDESLDELANDAFIYLERTMPQEIYAFRHVLAQQSVYGTLPPTRRSALHGLAGAALEKQYHISPDEVLGLLAYHFERSREDEKAVDYLLRAADKSRRAYLTEEAQSAYERALQRMAKLGGEATNAAHLRATRQLEAYVGLGQIHSWTARYAMAEQCFRQAIELATEQAHPARELARLYFWLGENLNWQDKNDESIRLSLQALTILGDDTECAEAAMLNAALAWSYIAQPNPAGFVEYGLRSDAFIESVPFSEDMRSVYACTIDAHDFSKHEARAAQLSDLYEERSRRVGDLWGLAEIQLGRGRHLIILNGDHARALDQLRQASDLLSQIGDPVRLSHLRGLLGTVALHSGDLELAEAHLAIALDLVERAGFDLGTRLRTLDMALLSLARHNWQQAIEWLGTDLFKDFIPLETETWLGRIRLAQGQPDLARLHLTRALDAMMVDDLGARLRLWSMVGWRPLLVDALSAFEETCDDADEFMAFCREFRSAHPVFVGTHFQRWHLAPADPDVRFNRITYAQAHSGQATIADDGQWTWDDPYGDCCYVEDSGGVTICPAILRDLWFQNRSAPRLLREVENDFAMQVLCCPATEERLAMGGLLLWQDEENYLRLGIGIRAQNEVSLEGCVANQDIVFGRGTLRSEEKLLRLERRGAHVRALCSADGKSWYAVGECYFPGTRELRAGICALGNIDRTIYFGPFAEGTAIHFSEFTVATRP
ncbi:MAG: BREX system ATP-binding domain-containing protein [Caldilineaceae bacterium]